MSVQENGRFSLPTRAARVLEKICLEPKIMHASEHDLDPAPSLQARPPTA